MRIGISEVPEKLSENLILKNGFIPPAALLRSMCRNDLLRLMAHKSEYTHCPNPRDYEEEYIDNDAHHFRVLYIRWI